MVRISASLLAADFACLGEDVRRAEIAGVDAFHFDMMDGHYVPNIAFAPQHLKVLRNYTGLPFHLHLELGNPDFVLENFPELDADLILVQWDTIQDPAKTFSRIMNRGAKVGLSLNPADDISAIKPYLHLIDSLLLLSVNPGFGGQKMVSGINTRVSEAKIICDEINPGLPLAIDGGITFENAGELIKNGIDWLIIGTALFNRENMGEYVSKIKEY